MKNIWQWVLRLFGFSRKPVILDKYGEVRNRLPVFENLPEPPPAIQIKRKVRFVPKIYADKLSGKYPPRPMTEREKELFAIKPNLQYWVNKGVL